LRHYGRVALYEVIKGNSKPNAGRGLGQPDESEVKNKAIGSEVSVQWRRKPRFFQLNSGRVEVSLPFQYIVVIILGLLLIFVLSFRLGQLAGARSEGSLVGESPETAVSSGRIDVSQVESESIIRREGSAVKSESRQFSKTPSRVEPMGDHRIVIQQYQVRADLVPVQQYFAKYGIGTDIEKRDMWYFLITSGRYDNPNREGTEGYKVREKIIELGASYKSPVGYETFGTRPFATAYGEKVK